MPYVYGHKRLDNNQFFYIGIGSDLYYKRANEKSRRSEFWKKIVNKYDYKVTILYDNISFEDAKIKEIELIKKYGRIDNNTGILCNMTDGGDGTKNKVINESYRKKLSESAKKRDNSAAYKRMYEGRLKYKITQDHKNKLSKLMQNRPTTEKMRQTSIQNMLLKNPSKGKLGKNSINYKFDIECYKNNKLLYIFNGVHEAARNLNLNPSKISAVLNKRRNHTGGYFFKKIL